MAQQALFITTKDIQQFTAMNGSVDPDNFVQFVKIAQDLDIQNYLGTDLFVKINDDIVAGTLAGDYLALVNTYVSPMLIHWAMVYYLPWAAYTVANRGIYKHNSENSESVSKTEVDYLIEKERTLAMAYTQKFIKYICHNTVLFPEYSTNTDNDVSPSRSNSNFGGWQL
jgi:hypothetical protein